MKHSSKKSLMSVLTLLALTFSALGVTPALADIDFASFAAKVDFSTGTNAYSVAIGDLDGDGKPDLAVTNSGSNTVSVFRNTSTSGTIDASSFAARVNFTTGSGPFGVAIGDLDGDGKPDLAVTNYSGNTRLGIAEHQYERDDQCLVLCRQSGFQHGNQSIQRCDR